MSNRTDAATTRDGKVVDFGAHVTVHAITRPWIGHSLSKRPRYYPGRTPWTSIRLAAAPDAAMHDHWPGAGCPDSDGPFPQSEAFLRYRRLQMTPRRLRAVVLRAVTRTEGRFLSGRLTDRHPVRLLELAIAPPHQPRLALACAADLTSGWRDAA